MLIFSQFQCPVTNSQRIYEMKYSIDIYDYNNELIFNGILNIGVEFKDDKDTFNIVLFKVIPQTGFLSNALLERAVSYPDLKIFYLNKSVREELVKKGSYNVDYCEYQFKDIMVHSFRNGEMVKSLRVSCIVESKGIVYLEYEQNTGILLKKTFSIRSGNNLYYIFIELLYPIDEMSYLSINDKNLMIVQTIALIIIVISISVYLSKEKYRII